jgi:hypothetical protein
MCMKLTGSKMCQVEEIVYSSYKESTAVRFLCCLAIHIVYFYKFEILAHKLAF